MLQAGSEPSSSRKLLLYLMGGVLIVLVVYLGYMWVFILPQYPEAYPGLIEAFSGGFLAVVTSLVLWGFLLRRENKRMADASVR